MRYFLLIFCLSLPSITAANDAPPPALPAAGTNVSDANISQYPGLLDEAIADLVKQGLLSIDVGEHFDILPNSLFDKLSRENAGKSALDPDSGQIVNYSGGLPFPGTPDMNDSQAGLKLAWNMRYAYGGDNSTVDPFIWEYRDMDSGDTERTLSFVGKTLRFKHRVAMSPQPSLAKNPNDVFNAIYLMVKKPFDLRNTQLLIHRLEDDSAADQSWMYLSFQRRVRRLPSGQTTDAFLGSDIMIEDFLGYNGRIKDMTWTYKGARNMLAPVYRHNEITRESSNADSEDFQFGNFHGQGNCFPDVPWQLRELYVLEAIPTWEQHPLSKRVYYVDAQTHAPLLGLFYDRSGDIWRVAIAGLSHPDSHLAQNKGSGVAIASLVSTIDVQAKHCTTLKMKTMINLDNEKQNDFSVQALRLKGR